MKRYYIIVDGRVQGVGFRYTVSQYAAAHHLTGWVRNLSTGMVDMQVQGDEMDLFHFLQDIQKPHHFIRVDDIQVKMIDVVTDEKSFRERG